MKGRKPNPTAAAPAGRCPSPPAWLTDLAKQEWRKVARLLHKKGLMTSEAIPMVASYCTSASIIREAELLMRKDGRVVLDGKSYRPHPAFRMQQAAMKEMRLLAAELQISPHRQPRPGADEPEISDEDLGLE